MRRALFVLSGLGAIAFAWPWRGLLRSVAARRLAASIPNSARRRGLDMRIPTDRGGWIRHTLKVDISRSLSEVVGQPLEAAAYSHFGGFNLSRVYSDFLNPDSVYYQAWIGAYAVFDGERRHFGFDDEDRPLGQDALDVLEADQRLVLGGAGCPHWFPDGRRVRLIGEMRATEVELAGERWWRLDGRAETWSAYHRGSVRGGHWRSEAGYGRVPADATHPVDDYHPLTYAGSFWLRYYPHWQAACAKFYIYPEYRDRAGRRIVRGRQLEDECRRIVQRTVFSMPGAPARSAPRSPVHQGGR